MILNNPDYQKAIDLIQVTINKGGLNSQQKRDLIFRKAGYVAEKQMAFQLQSYFGTQEDALVINNLKITHNTGAQMDHLILGNATMFYVESKSISDTLHVDKYGDWTRIYKGNKTGMKSPVQQVKRQSEVLFDFINQNKAEFRRKIIGLQGQIGMYAEKRYVAISEKGKITGERDQFKDVVVKYDHIPDLIKKALPAKGITGLLSFKNKDSKIFNQDELTKLGELLISNNVSLEPVDEIKALIDSWLLKQIAKKPEVNYSVKESSKSMDKVYSCGKCASVNMTVEHGRYGYYFKCSDCDKNTAIKKKCSCGSVLRVKNSKDDFYFTCKDCYNEFHFFTNNSKLTAKKSSVVVVEGSLLKEYQGTCLSCHSINVTVKNNYGYKVSCQDCKKTEDFQVACPSCGDTSVKLKKAQEKYQVSCLACDFSAGYLI